LLDAVGDLCVDLCSGKGSVDAGRRFGGITTKETWALSADWQTSKLQNLHTLLVQDNDIAPVQVDGVRSTQAGHCCFDVRCQLSGVGWNVNLQPPPTTITLGAILNGM
jgi:hypothetical protein